MVLKAPLPAFASIVRHTERTEWELYECNICHGKSQENFRYFHIVVDFWVTEKDKGVMTVRATCSLSPSFILATLIASFLLPPFSPLCFLFPPTLFAQPPSLPFLPPCSLKPPHSAGTLLDNQDVQMESTTSISAFAQLLSSEGGKAVFSEDAMALRCRTDGQMLS